MNCNICAVDLRGLKSLINPLDGKELCRWCFYKYLLGIEIPDELNDSFIIHKENVIT